MGMIDSFAEMNRDYQELRKSFPFLPEVFNGQSIKAMEILRVAGEKGNAAIREAKDKGYGLPAADTYASIEMSLAELQIRSF